MRPAVRLATRAVTWPHHAAFCADGHRSTEGRPTATWANVGGRPSPDGDRLPIAGAQEGLALAPEPREAECGVCLENSRLHKLIAF
jgi:hypothetical protein